MNTRFLTVLITLTFLGFSVSAFAKGKPTKPPTDPAVVYTVELRGVFNFLPERVTLNSKGRLNSVDTLVIEGEGAAWNAVFTSCAGYVPTNDLMKVNFDDWGVGRNGDDGILWISLANIRLPAGYVPEKEIQIQLGLRDDPVKTAKFPPTDSTPLYIDLNSYVVWGKPLSGKGKNKGWDTCYSTDLDDPDMAFVPADLVIAIWEEED